jgi:hypothetical protein
VALVLALFLAPAFRPGVGFLYRDTGRLHAPTKRWIAEELSHGRLPEWNPHAGLGNPVVASAAHDAPLHPFNALLVALPATAALDAWVILSFAAAAAGAFLCSRRLGWGGAASAVAALAFSLSGPLVSATDNVAYLTTYAALPWLFAAAHRHAERGGPAGLALVGVASALCVFGGDPQGWAIAVALLPGWGAVTAPEGARVRAALRGAAASAAAVLAAAPVIVPLALWLPHSERAAGVDEGARQAWNLHPRRLPELGVPGLFAHEPGDPRPAAFDAYAGNVVTHDPWFLSVYVGATVLALAALGAARDRRARWLAAAAVAFAWASLGTYAGAAQLAARLPVIGGLRYWEKVSVWVALATALAAARGAEELLAGAVPRGLRRAAAVAALLALGAAALAAASPGTVAALAGGPPAAAAALAGNLARGALHAALALGAVAVLWAVAARRPPLGRAAALAAVAVVAGDLALANAGAYVLAPAQREEAPELARALAPGERRVVTSVASARGRADRFPELGRVGSISEWGRRTLAPSWNVPVHVASEQGYAPLRELRFTRLASELTVRRREAALGLFGFAAVVAPFEPSLAARAGVPPPYRVVGADPALPAFLVGIPHRPRAYLAGDVRQVDEGGALAFALAGGAPGVSVVEGPVRAAGWPDAGEARVAEDRPGDTLVEARVDAPALLVLNDVHAPGWTATVDGTPAEIVRANYAVRGVWLQPGEHAVRFRYRTPGLAAGLAIALALALALAAWAGGRHATRRSSASR